MEYIINDKRIMKEWNWKKNKDIDPSCITLKSAKKVWWVCEKGHEWKTAISHVSGGTRCPYCCGQKVLAGFNDLASAYPKLLQEWDYSKNVVQPTEISKGTSKKVWWKCSKGHSYSMSVVNKTSKDFKCPICANRVVLKGFNDLKTKFPNLAREWNYKKNDNLKPDEVVYGSNKKVWWKCHECGYEWLASISSRSIAGNKCRNCAISSVGGKIALTKWNKNGNILQTHPYLVQEWNYEKNVDLKPELFHCGSNTKVWWRCPLGHEYQKLIYERTKYNFNCPICSNESKSSFPEQVIYYYCKKYYEKFGVINRFKIEKNEADIYIKSLNIAIEYDGYYFHNNKKSKKTELKKNAFFKKNNIKLIRVKESAKKDIYNDDSYDVIAIKTKPKYDDINDSVSKLLNRINEITNQQLNIVIDVEKDRIEIMNCYIYNIKQNSLAEKNPDIAKEWNYEKNGNLIPEMFSYSSTKKVWWKCPKGHEWEININYRTRDNLKCPICSNRVLLEGYNDLKTKFPQIAKEWNYKKNGGLKPENVVFGSTKKVWWICDKGHEWESTIFNRIHRKSCPYCNNKRILKGYNDLKTTNPEIMKEWDYKKNDKLNIFPDSISSGCSKKVWWSCSICGYEWKTSVNCRTNGIGCPRCAIEKQIQSFNRNQIKKKGSLLQKNPSLAQEWNYEKNGDLKPDMIITTSNKKVWWKCLKGHEWITSVCKRTNGTGCPYCNGLKKKVKNIDTGELFNSLSDAAKSCGLKTGDTISYCCKGKQKKAGGFRWRFVEN